jgi:glycosyltransferase involved in cell wall biosynthesis
MTAVAYQGTGPKHLQILALATEWGVSQGGVSVWNMEFCRALSKAGHSVTCGLVSKLGCTLDDSSISIVNAQYGPPKSLLTTNFDLIVGHGLHTGPYARYYRDEYFATARYVHVQHVDHIIEQEKHDTESISEVDTKEAYSRELLAAADFAVGVGPRLTVTAERLLSSAIKQPPILQLDPGIPSYILNISPRRSGRCSTRMLLVAGRTADWRLKGFDIAAKAAALLSSQKIDCLRVRGVQPNSVDELRRALTTRSVRNAGLRLDLRQFEGPDFVLTDLLEADCVLLPSRLEGFGLSAFESLCLGVPTLVTQASGLADLLQEKCPNIADKLIVTSHNPYKWAERIEWAIAPENANIFGEVREILTNSCSWEKAIYRFVEAVAYEHHTASFA